MGFDWTDFWGASRERVRTRTQRFNPSVAYRALARPETFWFLSLLLSAGVALWIGIIFDSTAIPPGGDPGNWVASAYAYIGHPYPSQLIPFAYPPFLFPVLGAFVAAAGPIGGVQLFVPLLVLALGLSTAWLARTILRSSVMAFVVVAFLMVDPALLAMFFWGAYPNLLAFVFMNVAMVGVLRACRGNASTGALQFWLGFSATILTHSLAGVVLIGWLVLFLVLGYFVALPGRRELLARARQGRLEAPGLASRAMFASAGGQAGLVFFLVTVGGYYGGSYLLGIPHPYYFISNASAFGLLSYGATFQAILPHVTFSGAMVFDLLVAGSLVLIFLFAYVRDRRPQSLTASLLLLLSWVLSTALLLLMGMLLQIVTDYVRFGFFLLIPFALSAAYVVEHSWVLHRPATPTDAPTASPPPMAPPRLHSGSRGVAWHLRPDQRRPATVAILALFAFILVVAVGTAPAMVHNKAAFTQVGHDPAFLDAVSIVTHSNIRGGILTVPGAEKWVRALTGENAYAPYSTPIYLFYPSQERDAQLAYFALTSHYALSNGQVVASIHGTNPAYLDGLPDYSVFVVGGAHPVLRVLPASVQVTMYHPATGSSRVVNLSGTPVVAMPQNLGGPMLVQYAEADVLIQIQVSVAPQSPKVSVNVSATGTGSDSVEQLALTLSPAPGAAAFVSSSTFPGAFTWRLDGVAGQPMTFGNVTPASGLSGLTNYDSGTGGPAIQLLFRSSNGSGSPQLSGTVVLVTPSASSYLPNPPQVIDTRQVWQELGASFVLMRNSSFAPNPLVAFPNEVNYLAQEYSIPLVYQNPEWSVLILP
jgi:hypothetical protein